MSPPRSIPPEKIRLLTPIVYGAQFAAILLYTGVGVVVISGMGAAPPAGQGGALPEPELLQAVLGGVGLVMLVVLGVLRRLQLSPDRWRGHFEAGDNAPWMALHRLAILTGSLLDGVGILGFILAILTRDVKAMIPFVAVAGVLMLLLWPRPSLIESMRERLADRASGDGEPIRRDDEAPRLSRPDR